jgi:molybdopterin synthase sulfur carrier subunit
MEVQLRFFATFREAVGSKTIEREYAEDATVGDALRALEEEFEGLSGQLLDDGRVRSQVSVLRNGRDVEYQEGIETRFESGDTLSVFPPVAGGVTVASDETATREKSYRGISKRLAAEYLEKLGGDATDDDTVVADEWTASLAAEKVSIGPTLSLTEVTVTFEGDPETLDELVERFSQKAMRAGG